MNESYILHTIFSKKNMLCQSVQIIFHKNIIFCTICKFWQFKDDFDVNERSRFGTLRTFVTDNSQRLLNKKLS